VVDQRHQQVVSAGRHGHRLAIDADLSMIAAEFELADVSYARQRPSSYQRPLCATRRVAFRTFEEFRGHLHALSSTVAAWEGANLPLESDVISNPSSRIKLIHVLVRAGSAALACIITVGILKGMLLIAAPTTSDVQARVLARAASAVVAR